MRRDERLTSLRRDTDSSALPKDRFLVECLAVRLDDALDGLPCRVRIRMNQEEHLRLLTIDAAGRRPPLALSSQTVKPEGNRLVTSSRRKTCHSSSLTEPLGRANPK